MSESRRAIETAAIDKRGYNTTHLTTPRHAQCTRPCPLSCTRGVVCPFQFPRANDVATSNCKEPGERRREKRGRREERGEGDDLEQVPGQYSTRGRHDGAWSGTARLSGLMWMEVDGWPSYLKPWAKDGRSVQERRGERGREVAVLHVLLLLLLLLALAASVSMTGAPVFFFAARLSM